MISKKIFRPSNKSRSSEISNRHKISIWEQRWGPGANEDPYDLSGVPAKSVRESDYNHHQEQKYSNPRLLCPDQTWPLWHQGDF